MSDRQFHWHPKARLFDGRGQEQRPLAPAGQVIAAEPSVQALALALAVAGQGFRIGAGGDPPTRANLPMFETLTSGSSGAPRRIWRSQASWTASFAVNAGLFGIGPGARVAVLGRLIHSLSLYGALEGMHLGAEVHLLADLRPDRQAKALRDCAISHLYATPAQLRAVAAGPACPALRTVLVGGSKLDAGLRDALRRMAPAAALHEFYGAAETSFVTLADPTMPQGSVGRAYPGVTVDLRGDPAQVWVQSPYLFDGYAGDAGTAEWRDGWLSVGEYGRMQGGYLYLLGRAGRMVTIADQNVFPEEIEVFLADVPGVTRVAVLPVPDARRGTVLVAVVQGDRAAAAAILAAARRQFGTLKAPKTLIWREEWPVLASDKTDFPALQRGLTWPE